ncbi:tetratricopeptide repeat protein [Azospirillum sp.]|uniref:tetratricopeptide repeat protein n=1 Tax=Azospirillum sp. TaxID=34012 RepID=UPI002D352856|nr:tetratricopeptide repeat protein [Azospirillum sp.]HYD68297.1 tetratricopeptide repeat protein [Azospirillum sp.]
MDYLSLSLLAAISFFGVSVVSGLGGISVEPISVPPAIVKQGYTPEVLTRQMADEMRHIREVAGSRLRSTDLPGKAKEETLQQLGEYFGIQIFVDAARRHLGVIRVAFSGEIHNAPGGDDVIELRIRAQIDDGRTVLHTYRGRTDEVGRLLKTAAFDAMVVVDPYVATLYRRDEEMKAGKRDLPGTYELIEHCFKVMPRKDHHLVFNLWGRTLLLQGRYDEAIEKFSAAIEMKPEFGAGYLNIGRTLIRSGKHAAAVETLERALASYDDVATVHRELFVAHAALNQPAEALAHIEKAIRAEPDEAELHAMQGAMYQDLGRHSDAAASYRQAVRLAPTETKYQEGLSRALGAKSS